jgi:hypothetical protein
MPEYFIVKLTVLAAAVWFLTSLYDILGYSSSLGVKIDLFGFAVIGTVFIVMIGLGLQWAADYFHNRKPSAGE